jgi:ATP-binding cassette subfamily B protein
VDLLSDGAMSDGVADPVTDRPAEPSATTIFDFAAPANRASQWRRIPRLTLGAIRLVGKAARRELIATTILQFASGVAMGLQLLVGRAALGKLVAISRNEASATDLIPQFAMLIGVAVLLGACAALSQQQQRLLVELVNRYTLSHIVNTASSVDLAAYEDHDFFNQLQRASTSGIQRPVDMVSSVTTLLTAILTSAGIAVALATIEPLLLPLVALSGVPLLLTTLQNSRKSYAFEYGMTPEVRERMYLMQLLTGRESAKEIRVFGATRLLRERYDVLTDDRLRRLRSFLRRRLVTSMLGTVGAALATTLALGSLVYLLSTDRIDIAGAVTAGVAMQLLASRLGSLTGSIGRLVESSMFLDDFQAFLDLGTTARAHSAVLARRSKPSDRFEGLEIRDLSFVYPGTDHRVLDDVSLRIEPGQVVALVGENGSGKTTLVKLICQLYRPELGQILWNGRDVNEFDPDELRSNMTVIFQDFIQYHLSVRDNIALGRVERAPEPDTLLQAARQAGAEGFLSRLPNGWDTRLGRQFHGGHELSVGQWQRLALARAFFRGGDFLVLDEPTASLDPKAEAELFAEMRGLSAGRSVLLISHRFSSVRAADQIYVLQHGRVTEVGSHAELLARGGHYADLFNLQAAAYL